MDTTTINIVTRKRTNIPKDIGKVKCSFCKKEKELTIHSDPGIAICKECVEKGLFILKGRIQ